MSCHRITETILSKSHNVVKKKKRKKKPMRMFAGHFSLTIDVVTSSVSIMSLISLTVQWRKSFYMQNTFGVRVQAKQGEACLMISFMINWG